MLPQHFLSLLVWCQACRHQAPADLQALVDAGRGDVPVKDLRFRCTACGSRRTDQVVMARDALRVAPWH
jgi:Zn finger protein HypA/HybF involved in hydrogenase expression